MKSVRNPWIKSKLTKNKSVKQVSITPKLIRPKEVKAKKAMTTEEINLSLLLITAAQFLVWKIDELKETAFYQKEVVAASKHFQNKLEQYAKNTVWRNIENDEDIDMADDQQYELMNDFEKVMKSAIAATELPPGQKELYYEELTKLNIRFRLPLRVDYDGRMRF